MLVKDKSLLDYWNSLSVHDFWEIIEDKFVFSCKCNITKKEDLLMYLPKQR